MLPILVLLTYLHSCFVANPIEKQLTRKWELVGVQMFKSFIGTDELKRKNSSLTMQIFEDGRCVIRADKPQAIAKENRWFLESTEKENFLIIEAENDFGKKIKSKFKIEEISNKKLVLSIGEAQDKETYYYRAVR